MFERIEREALTKERIRRDLIYAKTTLFYETSEQYQDYAIFAYLFTAVFLFVFFYYKLPLPFLIPIGLIFSYGLYKTIRQLERKKKHKEEIKKIANVEFSVSLDTLTHTQATTIYEPHSHGRYQHQTKEVVYFYFKGGRFRVLPMTYYSWSQTYHLSSQGLINTSVAGNEFYVVREEGASEIGFVYNTKFFKYDEAK